MPTSAPDWIGQMLVETLLDSPEKNDYLLAKESARRALEMAEELEKELDKQRDRETKPKALSEYTDIQTSTFTSAAGVFSVKICLGDAGLCGTYHLYYIVFYSTIFVKTVSLNPEFS
ncbi:hypothetical protein G7Y79_00033g067950 [Physcia stellaris]|nr:hypothetical protein G7Y79_00033g067950 [Physcia stellaris]